MAKLEYGDPTLEAMFKKIEARQHEEGPRDYLGASLIGNECARQIWYEYNHYTKNPFTARTLMMFEDGHRSEDLTAERLRMIDGIELHTHKPDGKQFGFKKFDGKFGGHCDGAIRGLLQAPKAIHVWEHKSCEEKKYRELEKAIVEHGEKQALKNWNTNYYVQAQTYMHNSRQIFGVEIDRHYMTVSLAGGRNYQSCRTNYDGAVAEKYEHRAEKIINATEPPPRIRDEKDFYLCRWCNFKDTCHG